MATGTSERHFEDDIVRHLTQEDFGAGYSLKNSSAYNKDLCIIEEDVLEFIKTTQGDTYHSLQALYGATTDEKIIQNLDKSLRTNKTLKTLREGQIRMAGQTISMCFFKPNHDRSTEHMLNYTKNRLTVIRQLKYSRINEKSLDLVLFVNGLPVVTMELKNALTGQYLQQAIDQYKFDRDIREKLFEFKRCLVHFAVSTEKVSMTTCLAGRNTHFLPFNMGLNNINQHGFGTAFLWEDVLSKGSLLDLIQNYINLQINEERFFNPSNREIDTRRSEVMIFPRYHQRRAINRILDDLVNEGIGQKYLIQHSAGSGKSNTISWLAHRLSDLYQNPSDQKAMFDSTIVVTDRRVLDKQIQDNIRQFEQIPGAVAYIGDNKTSQDLKLAIEQGKRIIVTTLQKFPVISNTVSRLSERNFAVIIDEAHSSQSGEAARHLRKSLSLEDSEYEDVFEKCIEDIILDEVRSKGSQGNISFFAFTATPKNKTLEIFGTTNEDGDKTPFDLYTMEQAIKENFILDVLKNYMSWKRYYKLIKRSHAEDKEYEKKQAVRVLANYVDLQDHAVEKKSRIMLEHFCAHTQHEIQGTARAMLVTRSRLHAVRYKLKFDEIMREMNLPYGALVAFSGTVRDSDTEFDYTETSMNRLESKTSIPDALKFPQFRILIVANKYQTGFDEPLLHTMFVDKKLGSTATVQTLSRLNRAKKGKDTTMVLDFVNDPEEIREDFQRYYGSTIMELENQTDPNSIYDVLNTIKMSGIIYKVEVDRFSEMFFTSGDHKHQLQPILSLVIERFTNLSIEEKDQLKANINVFIRLYRFLSQIMSFADIELERFYVFLSALFKKLPFEKNSLPVELLEDIQLESYKMQHQYTADLNLTAGNFAMEGIKPAPSSSKPDQELELLTKIIEVLNEAYGLNLKEEDQVDFLRVKQKVEQDTDLMSYFNRQNSKANIQDKFNDVIDDALLDFVNNKLELYNKLTEDKANATFKQLWFNEVYDRILRNSF